MGGPGSGRFYRYDRKATVEECRSIEAGRWMREGILVPDAERSGGWGWIDVQTERESASIGYHADTRSDHVPFVRLIYRVEIGGESASMDYRVELVTTALPWGGVRWWFVCPLAGCGRRVGKLHLRPGGRHFGCRTCYDLTNQSSQDSHKYDRGFAMLAAGTSFTGREMQDLLEQRYGMKRKRRRKGDEF